MSNGHFLMILILLIVYCFMSSAIGSMASHYSTGNDTNISSVSSHDRQKPQERLNTSMENMTQLMNRTSNETVPTNATNSLPKLNRDLHAEIPKANIAAPTPCRIEPISSYSLVGFRTIIDLDIYIPMLEDKNFTSAEKFLNETNRKIVFKSGDEVYIDNDLFDNEVEVRRPGETETWWVIKDAVVCP